MKKQKCIKRRMKKPYRLLWLLLIIVAFIAQLSYAGAEVPTNSSPVPQRQLEGTGTPVPGELIVTVQHSSSGQETLLNTPAGAVLEEVADLTAKGFTVKDTVVKGPKQGTLPDTSKISSFEQKVVREKGHIYLVTYDGSYDSPEKAALALERHLNKNHLTVHHIEPNYQVEILEQALSSEASLQSSTIHKYQQWNYEMINLQQAWSIGTGSDQVSIAVLDTGIDHNHESLRNLVARNRGKNFSSSGTEGDTMDRQGHGTHVAGIIASYNQVSGVMNKAQLIPVKVMGDDGRGSQFGIIKGIYHAVEQGADVINMSIGSKNYSSTYEEAVNFARQNDVIVVAATGNDGIEGVYYPARYDSVIGVGSMGREGVLSGFSNYGQGLNLVAPGGGIYSTAPGNGYRHSTGTSMAAPHVAGVAGLMRAADPSISADNVQAILENTAVQTKEYSSLRYGNGLVSADKALMEVQNRLSESEAEKGTSGIRISGANRYETAYHIAKYNNPNPETVIIVRGDSVNKVPQVVDGLTASGLAGVKDAQILLVTPNSIPSSTAQAIQSLSPKKAIVVGGPASVSDGVFTDLEKLIPEVERVSGANRYATAVEVALEMGSAKHNTALIVNGHAYVDSLVAGPLAHQGYPILMVNNQRGQIPKETITAIEALGIENLILVGGQGVISKDLEEQLNRLDGVQVKSRYGGSNRVSTSLLLGSHPDYQEVNKVSIVNGHSYVDAVAASTLGAPVVYYTERGGITEEMENYLLSKKKFKALGGTRIICETTFATVQALMR